MKRGKYETDSPVRGKTRRILLPLVLALLVLVLTVGGTLAYIIAQTGGIANVFTPAQVQCSVNDDLKITNTGTAQAYIRAMVIVNWVDGAGNVSGESPSYAAVAAEGWGLDDATEIYYYNSPVSPGQTISAPVVVSEDNISANPDSSIYTLQIEVVAEAIQAEGMGAESARDAWAKAQGNG